ncbi:DMT family transporter [Catellatospora citrea]|uniref:DMT family transporter n=1 Tax=Catellatospora citrea TaxID=53366 RepID=UPI000FF2865C|nr:DMT family transporter [Catellatospora citrea]RKE09027.1 threonine/homoserine efflux transporter RhtA [Catellatospora citrea]
MTTTIAPDTTASAARSAWLPAFAANAVIWGSSFIFIKIGVRELHPTWVAAGRIVIGALTLLALLLIAGQRLPGDRRLWGHMLLPGVVGVALPFTLFAYGEERVDSLVAGIWNATTALWVLPFAVLVYRTEKFTARSAGGLLIGFAGVLMVLGFWHDTGASSLAGQLMCGAAAACYGVSIPYLKRFVTGRDFGGVRPSGVSLAFAQTTVAALASVLAALLVSGMPPAVTALSWPVIGSVVALGVFGSGIAFALNMRVIAAAGASMAAFVTYLVPVVATLLGILVLGESLHWNQPVGALIVLLGVAVAQGALSRRRPAS